MYKQENKAGIGQYLLVVLVVFAAIVTCEFIGAMFGMFIGYGNLIGDVLLILICVVMVFVVYNHYASVFNYKITKNHIVIEKKTGRKVTEYDIPIEEINKIYIKKNIPKLKGKKLRLCFRVLGYRKTTVMMCGENNQIIVFEPDDKFIKKIKEYMND